MARALYFRAESTGVDRDNPSPESETICGLTTDNRCTLLMAYPIQGDSLADHTSRKSVDAKRYRAGKTVMDNQLDHSRTILTMPGCPILCVAKGGRAIHSDHHGFSQTHVPSPKTKRGAKAPPGWKPRAIGVPMMRAVRVMG